MKYTVFLTSSSAGLNPLKNLVLISAGLVLGAAVRGGKIVSFSKE